MAYIVINDVTREVFLRKSKKDFNTYEQVMWEIPDEQVPIYEENYKNAREKSFGTITEFCKVHDKKIVRDLKKLWASTLRFFRLV